MAILIQHLGQDCDPALDKWKERMANLKAVRQRRHKRIILEELLLFGKYRYRLLSRAPAMFTRLTPIKVRIMSYEQKSQTAAVNEFNVTKTPFYGSNLTLALFVFHSNHFYLRQKPTSTKVVFLLRAPTYPLQHQL